MRAVTDLTPQEEAARTLYGAAYAESGKSAIDWWRDLPPIRRHVVEDFVARMREAFAREAPRG